MSPSKEAASGGPRESASKSISEYSSLPIPLSNNELAYSGLQIDIYAEERARYGHEARGHIFDNGLEVNEKPTTIQGWALRAEGLQPTSEAPQNEKPSHSRKWKWIGAVVLLLIVIGAVVGGVFGSKMANNGGGNPDNSSDNTSSSPQPSASASTKSLPFPVPSPTSSIIAPKSSITATGWRLQNSPKRIFVSFHDTKGSLVYTQLKDGEYSQPRSLDLQYGIKDKSPVAISVLPQTYGSTWGAQLELFYLNATSKVNGVNYNTGDTGNLGGFWPDSINEEKYTSISGGSLATYWPLTLFQAIEGNLGAILYTGNGWEPVNLSLRAKPKTKLAIVPITTNTTWASSGGWIGLLYQNEEGNLEPCADPQDFDTGDTEKLTVLKNLWSTDKFPKITLSEEASFAAFSVARTSADEPTDWVNSYILYQDESLDIKQILLSDEDKGWQTSGPKALEKADKGTDIACITSPMWGDLPDIGELPLKPASDINRCYFQKDGELVEVILEEGEWKGPSPLFKD